MSTKTSQYLERSIKNKHVITVIVSGKETIGDKTYASVIYEDEKILVEQDDLNERDVRDKVGLLLGAEVNIIITGYDENLKSFIGSRKEGNEILKACFSPR